MLNLQEFRSTYPQYNDMTDYELSTALHRSKYADMPYEQFAQGFGGPLREDERILQAREYNARHPEAPIEPQEIGQGGYLNDLGHAFAAGLNDLASLPFWAGEKGAEALGWDTAANLSRSAKAYFKESADAKREGYSADMKLAQDKQFVTEDTEGNITGFGSAWSDPRAVGGIIAESLPSMAGGMGIGAGIAKALIARGMSRGLAWGIGSSIGEGSVAGAQDSQSVYDAVMKMSEETLARSPEYQELLRGMSPEEARKKLADSVAFGTAIQTGFATGVLSAPAGALFGRMLGGETGKTLLRSIGKQGVAEGLEETAQSGVEQYLQQRQLQRADKSIDPMQGVANAAAAGGVAGMFMGGGMAVPGHMLGRRRAAESEANVGAEQSSESPEGGTTTNTKAIEPWWTRESQDEYTGPRGAGSNSLEAMRAGQHGDGKENPDVSIPWWRGPSHPQGGMAASIERGESVDLLQSDAAPTPAQRQWAAQTPWESPLAAPFPEASSFTMDAMLRPAVMPARPASNAFLSDVEHADSENFVRKFEEQERLEGDKAMSLYGPMSRMRESYPVSRGVLSQMGQQAMPLAVATANPIAAVPVPTQAQITNTQTAPRADTMAQAEALGMPAPNPLAPGARSGESRVQQMPIAPSNAQSLAPAMDPQPAIRETLVPPPAPMPSFANTQYAGGPAESARAATAAAPQARPSESRAELLQQLSPESRKEARRLTNAQLQERVRAERNPVKSDGEGIYFTAQIAEENQGHNTASGPSPEMVKSTTDKKAKEKAPHAAGRGTVAGNGGEIGQAGLPAQAKDIKETDHVDHDSGRRLERDSQGNASQNGMGEESFSVDGKRDGDIGGEGGRQTGENVSSSRGEGLPGHAAPAAGARRNSGVGEETSGIRERTAGSEHDSRGRGDGQHGLDVRRDGEEAVGKTAERSSDERVGTAAHLREVRKALPDLYPGQQEDVVFAEKRFRAGQGIVFTNGTGTGKTGLGLGVISRLVRAGRREILIAVPADKIGSDWITLGKKLGVPVSKLVDTKDAGTGVTVTTHANMAQNDALFNRQWDLLVIDEAHKLSSSQQGDVTDLLKSLRGLALHPRGILTRTEKTGRGPELTKEIALLREKKEKELTAKEKERLDTLLADLRKWRDEVQAEIEAAKGPNRADLSRTDGKKPGVLLLSATPFAYEKSVDYAEGFLFDYPEAGSKGGYNQPNSYEQFMIEHFGYRMRYGKLTRPDAEVDAGLMQRQFNSWLKKQGVLSSRNLDTPFDYDRRFILTENAIGQKIDEGLDFLFQNYSRYTNLHAYIHKRFDYLAKRYLLEAIKARESISIIRQNVRQGRKVVVFHQFNKGGGFNPFDVSSIGPHDKELYDEARAFADERPDLARLPLKNLASPVATLKEAFPEARVFSGLVSKKEREAAVKAFQTDEGGADVIIVQADAGEAGLSLHDTTGKHQRVLINLGLPTKPVTAIQQEGRIFRAGQQSNAMFRYLNSGTNWERYAFAQTIAQRASAAENLAMGEEARGLRDAFIQAFEDSGPADVGVEGEGTGGKAVDRALQAVTSEFERAKTFYFGQQKKTSRTRAQEGTDYFATPEPLGQKMVEWAGIEPGTDVLEPSAGHGAIARWFPESAKRTVVEPSAELSSRLMLVTDAKLRNHLFEKLDVVNKYDSVIMNPPFGKGGKTAMEHLEKAFRHLRRNGRIVAIVPDGPSMQKRLDAFFDYDEKASLVPVLRREITLPDVAFERAGTNVNGKVLIIDAADRQTLHDKGLEPSSRIELDNAESIGELFDRIENMGAPARLAQEFSGTARSAAAPRTEVAGPGGGAESVSAFGKAETTHAKKDIPLFVAKRERPLSDEEYRTVSAIAKKHGGYWSGYNKNGAVPGWQFGSMESRDSFIKEADEAIQGQESMASLAPGEYLPPRRDTRLRLRHAAAQRVADALGKTAKNAAPVRVVQHFDELPAGIRKKHAGNAAALEGVYDPATGTVWLVADNLSDAGRVAEVWAHEQIVHHGLRGMLSDTERRTVLNQLWLNLGGMGNAAISEVAKRYGLNPRSDNKARLTVMEEVLANLAEKRQAGNLDATEQGAWRKIVNAILRAWNRLVQAVSGRSARMGHGNVDALLADLGRYVMEGVPVGKGGRTGEKAAFASVSEDRETTGRAAWEQVKKDTEAWERQLDDFAAGRGNKIRGLTVGTTPDVLRRLGAKPLPIEMARRNLTKVLAKHEVPLDTLRDLPKHLADPLMVFKSATMSNAYVMLTEMERNGENLVAAIHFDVETGRTRINDIASIHDRSTTRDTGEKVPGWVWVKNQIAAGNLRYYDKTRSSRWFRERAGLQLPSVVNRESYRGVKILTEKDVVKPVAPQEIEEGGSPLASLGKAERVPRAYAESIASGVRQIRKVMGRSVGEDVEEILSNPEMGRLVPKNDLSIFERLFKLPHWIAKGFPSFAKLYDRQQRRSEDSMEATNKALAQMPLLFDADAKKRLEEKEYRQLAAMLNKWDGREIGALHGIEKFNTLGKTLWKDRPVLAHNPRYKEKFDEWLKAQPEPERVKQAFRQVRGALDDAFLAAYSKLAAMSDLADTDLETYRTDFGSIHNYFPHSRKGKYFVTATMGKGIAGDPRQVVFRKHFDVPLGSSVREEWAKIVAANRKDFPGATWNQPQKVEKLPDDILGAPIDVEAMEQLIKAAAGKIGDNEQAQEIQKLMLTGISDILKARGFGAHGIKRQNIPGYETENIKEVLYEYVSGLNGWLTKMEAASDFAAALGKINAQKTPRLWEYASQYVKDMLRNSDQIDRIAGNIKTMAFAWYLGANFKTAVVNATQNVIIGVPRLQMYVTGGGAQWIKGAMDTIGLKYTGTGVRGARNLTADEESMLQELYGNGVINAAYMDELQGQLTSSPVLKGWRRFIAVLGKPMAMVERFNRASLALAAYRAAKAGAFRASALQEFGLKDGEKMNHEQARDFAAMLVRDSHYEYGKGNQPEFLRSNFAGRMASPVYTFRSFGFNTLNLWWRALRQEGWEGRVFVAKSLGATIALGGLTAFPFYATMAALCAAASGDDEDWTSKIRKALPESDLMRDVACYGLPALAGVNIGGSLRMETPFTEGIEKGTTFKEAMTESLGALFGIPYDMAVNKTSKFFEAGKYGDGYKMIEALAPTFVANAMQAYRLATEGQTTIKGRPINSPGQPGARKLSGAEAMGKVLGFQPTSSAKSYEAYRAGKRQDAVRSDKVNDLAVLVLKSIDTGKPDGRIAMMKELRAWNKRMQEEGKPHMLIQPKDVLRRVKSRRRENRATPKQRQKGAAQMATWGV